MYLFVLFAELKLNYFFTLVENAQAQLLILHHN